MTASLRLANGRPLPRLCSNRTGFHPLAFLQMKSPLRVATAAMTAAMPTSGSPRGKHQEASGDCAGRNVEAEHLPARLDMLPVRRLALRQRKDSLGPARHDVSGLVLDPEY